MEWNSTGCGYKHQGNACQIKSYPKSEMIRIFLKRKFKSKSFVSCWKKVRKTIFSAVFTLNFVFYIEFILYSNKLKNSDVCHVAKFVDENFVCFDLPYF